MSLNCLTCQGLQRTDSETEMRYAHDRNPHNRFGCLKVERSWSGNLASLPYEQIRKGSALMPLAAAKKGHRRLHTTGAVAFEGSALGETGEPRLIRSCGMRRDWSFENLKHRRQDEKRKQGRKF